MLFPFFRSSCQVMQIGVRFELGRWTEWHIRRINVPLSDAEEEWALAFAHDAVASARAMRLPV